jgi:hypothetical protein
MLRWVHDTSTTCFARVPGGRYRVVKKNGVETLYWESSGSAHKLGRYPSLGRAQQMAENHRRFAHAARARTRHGNTSRQSAFKVSARETRGGWRGTASADGGVVLIKTVPVFRDKDEAEKAMRAWLRDRGAYADALRRYATQPLYLVKWRDTNGRLHITSCRNANDTPERSTSMSYRAHRSHARSHRYYKSRGDRKIPYRERKLIPKRMYALPERAPRRGALPLADPRRPTAYDPAHVRNAASRLAQMRKRGSVTSEEYRRAERAIIRAACACGVERTCRRHLATVTHLQTRATHETRAAAYSRRYAPGVRRGRKFANRSKVPRGAQKTRWGSNYRNPKTGQFV